MYVAETNWEPARTSGGMGGANKARAFGVVPKARAVVAGFSCSSYLMVLMVFCTIFTTLSGNGA